MYLVSKDVGSKIYNGEYGQALIMLLGRIRLLEANMILNVSPTYQQALEELINEQEKE